MMKAVIENSLLIEWLEKDQVFLSKLLTQLEMGSLQICFSVDTFSNLLSSCKELIVNEKIKKEVVILFVKTINEYSKIVKGASYELKQVNSSIKEYLPILLVGDIKVYIPKDYSDVSIYDGYEKINLIEAGVFKEKVEKRIL